MKTDPQQVYLTVMEAARSLHISESSIRRMMDDGQLAGFRFGRGRHRRVLAESVRAFVAQQQAGHAGQERQT